VAAEALCAARGRRVGLEKMRGAPGEDDGLRPDFSAFQTACSGAPYLFKGFHMIEVSDGACSPVRNGRSGSTQRKARWDCHLKQGCYNGAATTNAGA
jgi:hypothetical protein